MRILVFMLGVLASLLAGFFGWFWMSPGGSSAIRDAAKDYADIGFMLPNYAEWYTTAWAAVFLFAAAGLGLLGSVFVLVRRGRHGAVLMFLSVLGPAALNSMTLIFTGPLVLAGLLSIFVRPAAAAE